MDMPLLLKQISSQPDQLFELSALSYQIRFWQIQKLCGKLVLVCLETHTGCLFSGTKLWSGPTISFRKMAVTQSGHSCRNYVCQQRKTLPFLKNVLNFQLIQQLVNLILLVRRHDRCIWVHTKAHNCYIVQYMLQIFHWTNSPYTGTKVQLSFCH